jgi:asparagine synthase (glutamine-hydrolysing)
MCGIVGFLFGDRSQINSIESILHDMAGSIIPRGPDGYGYWSDGSVVALGHRRLSVVDVSDAGSQPMHSDCGRYVLVFNGEIYNHLILRNSFEKKNKISWKGHSDTETLLYCFSVWGIDRTLESIVGMFSMAVWDRNKKQLVLVRDRLGEKPLYYGWIGQGDVRSFVFGSDLAAIKVHPAFDLVIDRNALAMYVRSNYVPAPYSIYKDIFKLLPGHKLEVGFDDRVPVIKKFWSIHDCAKAGVTKPFLDGDMSAISLVEQKLIEVVAGQMIADVPIGAFLSGGVDSSVVVALMQLQSATPVNTYTIGFHEALYNEAPHAKLVAQHIGTNHNEIYVGAREAIDVIPLLTNLYTEPFADSSQIPTFLVSKLASQSVTVSLSGDGGDEIFGGYNRYVMTQKMWSRISHFPLFFRKMVASSIQSLPPNILTSAINPLQFLMNSSNRISNIGDKLHKGAGVLSSISHVELYDKLVQCWNPIEIVIGCTSIPTDNNNVHDYSELFNNVQRMMLIDTVSYLPDDILVKLDRASMGVSLESRSPFLDHSLVELAWRLPHHMKFRDGVGKWILREVLYRHVPKKLIDRPKMGFGIPIDIWLRGPLREWAENLLDVNVLREQGFFKPEPILKKWSEHLSGQRNWQQHLWTILMFQSWLSTQNISSTK